MKAWRGAVLTAALATIPISTHATMTHEHVWQPKVVYEYHGLAEAPPAADHALHWYLPRFLPTPPETHSVPIPSSAWLFGAGVLGFIGLKRRKTDLRWRGVPVRLETLGSGNPLHGEFHRIYRRMLCHFLGGHRPLIIGNTTLCCECLTILKRPELRSEDVIELFDGRKVDTSGMTMPPTEAPTREAA